MFHFLAFFVYTCKPGWNTKRRKKLNGLPIYAGFKSIPYCQVVDTQDAGLLFHLVTTLLSLAL